MNQIPELTLNTAGSRQREVFRQHEALRGLLGRLATVSFSRLSTAPLFSFFAFNQAENGTMLMHGRHVFGDQGVRDTLHWASYTDTKGFILVPDGDYAGIGVTEEAEVTALASLCYAWRDDKLMAAFN